MKILVSVMAVCLLTGCGVELLASTAIQADLQAEQLKAMKGQVQRTAETTGDINLKRAIQTFSADKGRFPATLDELVPDYIQSVPKHVDGASYGYDPATGTLSDAPVAESTAAPAVASGPTAGDREKIKQIQAAITRYGQETGYYPPALLYLVPKHLSALPKTAEGGDFVYNAEDGSVRHPNEGLSTTAAAPSATGRRGASGGGGGAGPMGEAMTGIAISNQLDSNSNAGVSSAGSYMREKAGTAGQTRDEQQQKTMDQLGF